MTEVVPREEPLSNKQAVPDGKLPRCQSGSTRNFGDLVAGLMRLSDSRRSSGAGVVVRLSMWAKYRDESGPQSKYTPAPGSARRMAISPESSKTCEKSSFRLPSPSNCAKTSKR